MQTAEERYEYAWQDYQASQERGEYKSLKSYCQSHHIRYEGMRYWKRKNIGPSNTTRSMSKPKPTTGFISITQSTCVSSVSGLADVQISCPSGMTVRIGSLSVEVLLQILSVQKPRRVMPLFSFPDAMIR